MGARMRKKIAGAVVVVVLLAGGAYYLVKWLAPPIGDIGQIEVQQSLEENWNHTIQRLGIEPVFPPEEDLAVGDIFAVAVGIDKDARLQFAPEWAQFYKGETFLKRSVKLAHIDVREALDEAYAILPVFTTPASPPMVVKQSPDPAGTSPDP